jgi:hypothetical protein
MFIISTQDQVNQLSGLTVDHSDKEEQFEHSRSSLHGWHYYHTGTGVGSTQRAPIRMSRASRPVGRTSRATGIFQYIGSSDKSSYRACRYVCVASLSRSVACLHQVHAVQLHHFW